MHDIQKPENPKHKIMAKKRTNRYSGRTSGSMERSKTSYGYLKLPDNVNMFKPEGGTEVVFDILEYPEVTDPEHIDNKKNPEYATVGDPWWKRPIRVHRDVGPEGVQMICPTTIGKRCPICEYGSKRRKAGADWDELKDIFPKNRTIYLVMLLDTQECEVDYTEGEVHIMDMADHNFGDVLKEEVDRDIDNDGFPDPYDGSSIQVYFRSRKLGKTKFAEASKIDFLEREQQYDSEEDQKFLAELPILDDILIVKDYEELEALYFGMEGLDEEDLDDQELEGESRRDRTRKTTSRRPDRERSSRSRRDRDEDEGKDEEDTQEEEKPSRSTSRSKSTSSRSTSRSKPVSSRTRKSRDEDTDEGTDEGVAEKKSTSRPRTAKTKCPFDHEFGVDTDQFDDCDKCKIWQDCKDEKGD